MKNSIKVLLFLLLTGITANSALAQKNSWTIGYDFGVIGSVWQKGGVTDTYRSILYKEFPFSFELTTSYGITNHLSISTGIAYIYNEMECRRVGVHFEDPLYKPENDWSGTNLRYYSIDIPIKLNFFIPIGKSQFYFTGNAGLIFDVIISPTPAEWVQQDRWSEPFTVYVSENYVVDAVCIRSSNLKKINFLINAGIGFGYRFKCGVGLWLMGDYNAGTRIMADVAIKNQLYTNPHYGTPLKEYVV